jgi:hypothetical protein
MRRLALVVFISILFGATTARADAIKDLADELGQKQGVWLNGLWPTLALSPDTPVPQVIAKVFSTRGFVGDPVTSYKILKIRQVNIEDANPGPFTAVLVKSNLGKLIVILHANYMCWDVIRVFDARTLDYR